jgi:signal transduction histidine kinase
MRSSMRTWLLVVSVLFAGLVVGGISLTTYVIVSQGMSDNAAARAQETAVRAASVVEAQVRIAESAGVTADEYLEGQIQPSLRSAGLGSVEFALYDETLRPVISSSGYEDVPGTAPGRQRVLNERTSTYTERRDQGQLESMFLPADLGLLVWHEPIVLPNGEQGVLDIITEPTSEEALINRIRMPMAILATSAMVIMVVLMQTSMTWVLRLVDDLREAADAIDAGRLDARLPDEGSNEIGDLARSLNRLIRRLELRSDAQTRFVADASHELATPVAGIRGYTSILRAWGADDPKVRDEAVDAIDRESRRMARLTGDLLNLLQSEQGVVLRSERFDVNQLARERIAATAGKWIEKDLEFSGPEGGPLFLYGDPDRTEDVLSILLDNAAKYTPPGGQVSLDTRRRRETIIIEISDTGQGISPTDLPHIFDRFYRTEASRTAGESGFGLGLAIAKTIVENAGGEVEVASEPGEGTTFTLQLPRGRG